MRVRILQAYMELASYRGLDGMTMDEVAAQAGISKRTLYRYFPSKEALLLAATEEFKLKIRNKVEQLQALELDAEQIVAEMLTTLFGQGQFLFNPRGIEDLRVRYPQVWQDIDQFRQEVLGKVFGQIIGELSPEVAPLIIRTILLTTVREVLNPEFIITNNLIFEDTARQVSRLLLRMLGRGVSENANS